MDLERLIIDPNTSLKDAIKKIDANTQGAVIVVDQEMRVLDLLTDGDIRRTILQNQNLDRPVNELRPRRENSDYPDPITAPKSTSRRKLLTIMKEHSIRCIPLLDENGKLIDVALHKELETQAPLQCRVVIMAGGYGKRLKPLTNDIPKPLLPVGEKPIIELLLNRLSSTGFQKVYITTHYRKDQIASYFNSSGIGIEIQFIEEKKPLGTAGALSLIEPSQLPLLVINGDILTMLDFRSMYRFHTDHENCMTVGMHQITYQVPYGVVQLNGTEITAIQEKPSFCYFVNAGIYIISPAAHGKIPKTESRFDMTDLIQLLLMQGNQVAGFPIHEYWLDIGHLDDYQKANEAIWQGEFR